MVAAANDTKCTTGFCRNRAVIFNPWMSIINDQLLRTSPTKSSTDTLQRRSDLDELRRATVRWGKRYDSEQEWQQELKNLLHPRNAALSPNWTPLLNKAITKKGTNDESDIQNQFILDINGAYF
ncbi:hypothetical protein Q1695_001278 [Nippostrongylus brasiliensis]|nr:hypothetical protein Q1695_001278 [Nippostrongylus brasiliensis]